MASQQAQHAMSQTMSEDTTSMVHFSVDGDGLTHLCRRLYIEGAEAKALAILYHIDGLPVSDAHAILEGRKRLTGVGRDMKLVADDATDRTERERADIEKWTRKAKQERIDDARRPEWGAVFARHSHDDEPPPEPPPADPTLAATGGWLAPDGQLYRCGFQEHDAVAVRLGIDRTLGGDGGWVHLQDSRWRDPGREITQAQLDAIFDWSQKHGKEMPYWTKT